MNFFLEHYWPHLLAAISIILGASASIHVAMTKREVRTAIGWVGVIILSPILGAVIYGIFGINRMRGQKFEDKQLLRDETHQKNLAFYNEYISDEKTFTENFQNKTAAHNQETSETEQQQSFKNITVQNIVSMKKLGDTISTNKIITGNQVTMLEGGDSAYNAMLNAIKNAQYFVLLESYIFNNDQMGQSFVDALHDAIGRGVEVRVLIDAVGVRYSIPTIVGVLKRHKIKVAVFNGNIIMGLRLPYANLRSHRKILVVDNKIAFSGGLNIQADFSQKLKGTNASHDTHFQIEGPAVYDLFYLAANHWYFATSENLGTKYFSHFSQHNKDKIIEKPKFLPHHGIYMRVVASGPTRHLLANNQNMLIGAFSLAKHHIRIMTPYLLPDRELISALVTAARRGVKVDIIIPDNNNLLLVDRAMWAQFDQLLQYDCKIWRNKGTFNHSKLLTIDNIWSYVGSSNIDSRSLRLNFEVDMEIFDKKLAAEIGEKIKKAQQNSKQVFLNHIKSRPFLLRLADKVIWLGSPYL